MTNTPPDPKSPQTNSLGFDEFIAILVAFVGIGAVLFWSLSRSHSRWNLPSLLLPFTTPSAIPTNPSQTPTSSPLYQKTPVEIPPNSVAPSQSPSNSPD